METEKGAKQAAERSRISPSALREVEKALRDYEDEVWEAGSAREGITEATMNMYTRDAAKFVAWLRYEFSPKPSTSGPMHARQWVDAPKIQKVAAKRSRISIPALTEVDAALDEYIHEVLSAKLGERATNQLGDRADYFVRWLKYEFVPGARKGWRGERKKKSFGPPAVL